MLAYLDSKYGGQINYSYSVGNEPDLWPHPAVPDSQLGHDAATLKKVLAGFNIGSTVYGSSYAHVSSTAAAGFIPNALKGGVSGLTMHNYPYGGHNCNVTGKRRGRRQCVRVYVCIYL